MKGFAFDYEKAQDLQQQKWIFRIKRKMKIKGERIKTKIRKIALLVIKVISWSLW